MNTIKRLFILCSIVTAGMISMPTLTAQETLSIDPELRKGVLPNGITYYIRHNEEPKDRASFYIMQNVGALLENEDQNGLAHFLEHMAFNGTENFPGKGVINTLQTYGVEFGRNLNAYTSFDETVYNISEVPNKEGMMDTCLLILHDWCNYLELKEEEIDAERGVITEEWRTRRTSSRRLWNGQVNYLLKDSKYTERDVIGSLDVINHHEYQTLRNFYHDWYRTDLQGIAVVGDFDVDVMEAKIKALFSPIPAVENALERYTVKVPYNEEPIFGLVTDKEATSNSLTISFKQPETANEDKDFSYYRKNIASALYSQMFSVRMQEIMQQENPPFLGGYSAYNEFLNGVDLYYIAAEAHENKEREALTTIMTENERVRRFGFTEGELERAKLNYMSSMESVYKQREKISNDKYAKEYVRNYLDNEPIPGIEKEMEYTQTLLPQITAEEINKLAKEWISYKHMVITVSGSEKEGITHLNQEEAFAIIDEVRNAEIMAYEDETANVTLLAEIPKGSKVKKTKQLEVLGAEEWTLKNGTKVVYRFSDIEKDRVYLQAISQGGTSLYDIADLPSAQMADMAGDFGIGQFDPTTLQKVLAGKQANVSAEISGLSEKASGASTVKDVETMFQLLYMTFEQPRFDESIYNSKKTQMEHYLANKANNPDAIKADKKTLILSDNHPRSMVFNEEFLAQVSLEKMEKIYKERFADGNDFTFFITGNISKEELQPLVETYIGGISVLKGSEKWVDNKVSMPEGVLKKEISIALEVPKTTVSITYGDADVDYSPENILYSKLLGDVLDIRYMEKVREEAGGTYGVGVNCWVNQYPSNEGTLAIGFDCDPEKADELIPIIYQELNRIIEEGPTQEDLDKVLVTVAKNRKQVFEKNAFWLQAMKSHYWSNMDIVSPSYKEDIIDTVTPLDIQNFAKELKEKSELVELKFTPEVKE